VLVSFSVRSCSVVYMCIITLYGMDFVGIIFSRWIFYVAMKQILSGAKSLDLVAM